MWQDALALLIVAIAGVTLLRPYIPLLRFFSGNCRHKGADAVQTTARSGCAGCALGSACAKSQAD